MPEDCIFCKIVAGEIPALIVDGQDEQTLAFMDIAPATRGHALVIPKRHATDLWEIEPDQLAAVPRPLQRQALRVRDRLGADGVNLINSCGRSGVADGFPFPHPRDPALRRGPAADSPGRRAPGDMDEIAAAAGELR